MRIICLLSLAFGFCLVKTNKLQNAMLKYHSHRRVYIEKSNDYVNLIALCIYLFYLLFLSGNWLHSHAHCPGNFFTSPAFRPSCQVVFKVFRRWKEVDLCSISKQGFFTYYKILMLTIIQSNIIV